MPKRLHLEEHLSSEELEYRYRKAKDLVLRTHLLIVWQLSLGKTTREVSEATGYSPEWIREISLRYNKDGVEGLGDRRHQNPDPSGSRRRTRPSSPDTMSRHPSGRKPMLVGDDGRRTMTSLLPPVSTATTSCAPQC